jgi:hypothetical protein
MDALDFGGHGNTGAAAPTASGTTSAAEGWATSKAAVAGTIAATRRPSRLSATLAPPTAVQEPPALAFPVQHLSSALLQQLPRIDSMSDVDAKVNARAQPQCTADKVCAPVKDCLHAPALSKLILQATSTVHLHAASALCLPGTTNARGSSSNANNISTSSSGVATQGAPNTSSSIGSHCSSGNSCQGSAPTEQAKHNSQRHRR